MLCDFCDGLGYEDGAGFEWPVRCHVCDGIGIIEPRDHYYGFDDDDDEDD